MRVLSMLFCTQPQRQQRQQYLDGMIVSELVWACCCCRYFRTDELTLRKRVVPWERFAAWCGVSLSDMQRLYRSTVGQQGLVHAVRGPSDEEDNTYSVSSFSRCRCGD